MRFRSSLVCVCSLILIVICFPYLSSADPLNNWHVIDGYSAQAVVWGNNMFVAVGGNINGPLILTSLDGQTWKEQNNTHSLFGVAYGNGMFMVVGDSGTILTSSDGVTWTGRSSGTMHTLRGGAYGNGMFMVVGDSGTILTSPDGITWTSISPSTFLWNVNLSAVAYGKGMFVIVGESVIFTSPDGIVRCQSCVVTTPDVVALSGVAYGAGIYVAVGGDYPFFEVSFGTKILYSFDGFTWTEAAFIEKPGPNGVTYGKGTFVVVVGSAILQSDPVNSNCSATLSSDLFLYLPIVSYNGTYLWGAAICKNAMDGSLVCSLTNYGMTDLEEYGHCQASTLTYDLKLHVPVGIYNNMSYQADFENVPASDGQILFKLVGASEN